MWLVIAVVATPFIWIAANEMIGQPDMELIASRHPPLYRFKMDFGRLKRLATWEEAVAEFKGTRTATPARAAELM